MVFFGSRLKNLFFEADDFTEGPSLEGTTARGVGRVAIGDFGDVMEAG